MTIIDIFNGDADGICALAQYRHAFPAESKLVTGVKRDIQLVEQAGIAQGDKVTVLDISLDKNIAGIKAALAKGAEVLYVDHHFAGDIPESELLTTIINTAADVCTSVLMNQHLQGKFLAWAVVGAFGDNLQDTAKTLAKPLSLSEAQLQQMQDLGIYMNYNGYGASQEDLHFRPADLYRQLICYKEPLDFIVDGKEVFTKLEDGYHTDMGKAKAISAEYEDPSVGVFRLPNAAWARRVSGVYGNDLANAMPSRAHAVLTERADGKSFVVSVRAPLTNKTGADELCRQFPTGGGRKAAAGINELPEATVDKFIKTFAEFYA